MTLIHCANGPKLKKVATTSLTKLIDVNWLSKESPLLAIEVQSFEPKLSANFNLNN